MACLYTQDIFAAQQETLGEGAILTREGVSNLSLRVFHWYRTLSQVCPPIQFITPMGGQMQVKTTSCGAVGWISSAKGYQYSKFHPTTLSPWPSIPDELLARAAEVAELAGYQNYLPDTCLVNLYTPGVGMGLHQDKNEINYEQPVVSFSFGVPAVFLWGGWDRGATVRKIILHDGDVVVWGGKDRLRYHGIEPLVSGSAHPIWNQHRLNLTFRVAQ